MKIKIDKQGQLYIERVGKYKPQYCPYTSIGEQGFLNNKINQAQCGDWCPLFSINVISKRIADGKILEAELSLCQKSYKIFGDDLIDERSK